MKSILASVLIPVVLSMLAPLAWSGPLQEAAINQIVNDVKVIDPAKGARPAAVKDIIRDNLAVRTGIQSRTELLFQDDTLTRLGAETVFSFKVGTRDLNLDRGTMLLQVPKNHGGARIRTASVTASITGTTIMMEYTPEKSLKVVVLEGSLRLSPNGRIGEAVNLTAGRMVIMDPKAKRIPEPVKVDLRKLVNTSSLINPVAFKGGSKAKPAVLPSIALIEKEIALQDKLVKSSDLVGTNLVIAGSGTEVVIAPPETLAQLDKAIVFDKGTVSTANGQIEAPMPTRLATAVVEREQDASTLVAGDDANSLSGNTAPTAELSSGEVAASADLTSITSGNATIASVAISGTDANSLPTAAPAPTTAIPTAAPTPVIPVVPTIPVILVDPAIPTTPATPATPIILITPKPPVTVPTPPAFITIPNPYVISNATTIRTGNQRITTNGVTNLGGLYESPAVNRSPSVFLFDTPSTFDTASGIDSTFSVMSGSRTAVNGAAVYRFAGLDLQGDPTFGISGGITDVALVSKSGINSNSSGSAWKLDSLRSLFFGTVNGPVTLRNQFEANSSSGTFEYLQVYARGITGSVTLDGKITLPLADLRVDAEQGINVTDKSEIHASTAVLNTPGNIVIAKAPVTTVLKLNAGGGIRFLDSHDKGTAEFAALGLQTTGDLTSAGGFLKIGANGIQAADRKLSGFDHIDVAGDVKAGLITVTNALSIGGTFRTGASDGTATLTADSMVIGGGIDLSGAANGSGGTLTLSATDVNVSTTGINGIKADGHDGLLALVGGGDGGTVNIGNTAKPVTNSITVDRPISASTGANGTGALIGGNGGNVGLVANGTIAVNSTVKVSDSALTRASRKGGNIALTSLKTSGTAISIGNTGQLLSLLNTAATGGGGKIQFTSSGGDILVNGGTVAADRGTVDIRNNGTGNIALNNANIRGDVVKVGALGANGQLLIGGGTLNADSTLNLYGGSSNGQVRFTGDTTLSGTATKNIAGKTVTIDDGRTVTVGGRAARVFTDNANYTGSGGNGNTTGKFAGSGATTQPYSSRPTF